MRVVGLPRQFYQANRITISELSPKAQQRLHLIWSVDNLKAQEVPITRATQALGLPRPTYYRWQKQLKTEGPKGLAGKAGRRRPKSLRKPAWEPGLILAVKRLREQYPGWGKAKLTVLLREQGFSVSESTVGRILRYLKRRGQLIEPPRNGVKARRRRLKRPHAERKPRDYRAEAPGDLIQLDTLDVKLTSWFGFKHFTAQDTVSRWNVVAAYPSASAKNARDFLEKLIERTPFEVKAIQVDGGSEFMAEFEAACREFGVKLFVLPPRSPKLNGQVERAHRSHVQEFYDYYVGELSIEAVNRALRAWEETFNTLRPHQALKLRSPLHYLKAEHPDRVPHCLKCLEPIHGFDRHRPGV
jgi:transposase InsO family protein